MVNSVTRDSLIGHLRAGKKIKYLQIVDSLRAGIQFCSAYTFFMIPVVRPIDRILKFNPPGQWVQKVLPK